MSARLLFVLTTALVAWSTICSVSLAAEEAESRPYAGRGISMQAATTLGAAAAASGRYFGTCVPRGKLNNAGFVAALNREFNCITCENEMKWDATEGSKNRFTYASGDAIAAHAKKQGMKFRGHTLVWHSQLPGWVKSQDGAGMKAAMINHIQNVAGHYKGQFYAWDVVNEAYADDGRGSRRPSEWQNKVGNGFIELAFKTAREVDPDAKLCYNDYNTDGINAKSTGVYNMVKDFKSRGVPIDCVGFQSHLEQSMPSTYQSNLQRFADLGVEVQITELDVRNANTNVYAGVVKACMAIPKCKGITVWGVDDGDTWRNGANPLLLDRSFNKKPAYTAVLNALNKVQAVRADGSNETMEDDPSIFSHPLCEEARENTLLRLKCPPNTYIGALEYASFGNAHGSCATALFTPDDSCDLPVRELLEARCVNRTSCAVAVTHAKLGGYPCAGRAKKLVVTGTCEPIQPDTVLVTSSALLDDTEADLPVMSADDSNSSSSSSVLPIAVAVGAVALLAVLAAAVFFVRRARASRSNTSGQKSLSKLAEHTATATIELPVTRSSGASTAHSPRTSIPARSSIPAPKSP